MTAKGMACPGCGTVFPSEPALAKHMAECKQALKQVKWLKKIFGTGAVKGQRHDV